MPNCETCRERGRVREGLDRGLPGVMCDRCFSGEGTPKEELGLGPKSPSAGRSTPHRRAQWRTYYYANLDVRRTKARANTKRWREANPEKVKEYDRKYRACGQKNEGMA